MSALPRRGDPLRALARPGGLAALAVTAFAALLSVQAADGPWLAELGRAIASRGGIPDGVPYATAPTDGLAERPGARRADLRAAATFGSRGVQVAQVAAVAGTLALLARDARRAGAHERALAIALLLLVPACFGPLVAIRAQLFSLPLFAACALLLRVGGAGALEPDLAARPAARPVGQPAWRRAHGRGGRGRVPRVRARRQRPGESVAVAVASALALCANPALWNTPEYVLGVLHNEAARQAIGLWAPLSPSDWLDVVFVLAAAVLLVAAHCAHGRALWELVALAGLALLTLHAARGGMWLALYAVPLAATGFGGQARSGRLPRLARPVALALLAAVADRRRARPAAERRHGARSSRARVTLAHGTPVLAEDLLAEQVADAGGRVWVANPIDAFRKSDQRRLREWLRGLPAGDAALAHAPRAVLVRLDGNADRRLRRTRASGGSIPTEHRALRARRPT